MTLRGSMSCVFFFFKQKTAYEMRISDWSSDVCSSDLIAHQILALQAMTDYERGITVSVGIIQGGTTVNVVPEHCQVNVDFRLPDPQAADELRAKVQGLKAEVADVELDVDLKLKRPPMQIGRASCRERVCQYV